MFRKTMLSAILVLSMLFALPSHAQWTNGIATNPAAGAVLCDSGPFSQLMAASATITVSSSVASVFRFQLRDAANTTTKKEQYFFVPANGTVTIPQPLPSSEFDVDVGERLRIIINAAVTGSVSCSMWHPF